MAQRPTKKQRELLSFIESFITGYGYGPSYREIMRGLNYSSVATVAAHVDNLIMRGHLQKKAHSARSLEVVGSTKEFQVSTASGSSSEEKWLVQKIRRRFTKAEQDNPTRSQIDELYVLLGALKVLGLDGAYRSLLPRLTALKQKQQR